MGLRDRIQSMFRRASKTPMKGNLGLVMAPYGQVPGAYPYEINRSLRTTDTFLCPTDPMYLTRGEYGLYHDTMLGRAVTSHLGPRGRTILLGQNGLGAIPTDAEIGKYYYSWYTPTQSSWIQARDRFIAPPWNPKDQTAWPFNPPPLGDPTPSAATLPGFFQPSPPPADPNNPTITEVVNILNTYHQRQLVMSAISTTIVAAGAILGAYRTAVLVLQERDIRRIVKLERKIEEKI